MPAHLSQGSTEPPLSPDKLRLYGMRFCPYDHRVHLVLTAKNIPHDCVYINLVNKPDWYKKRIPSARVPGLVVDGEALYESLVIADFLDEKYPQRPLHSKDPLRKAKDRILIENFAKVVATFYKMAMSPNPSLEDMNVLVAEVERIDKELAERATKYLSGDEPGMVDYMIWPWFERLNALTVMFGDQFYLPENKLKNLFSWMAAMEEDRVVKENWLRPQVYAEYLKGYKVGKPDYEIKV